jgi:eukaryotic-like serine/threonine-protein kinase
MTYTFLVGEAYWSTEARRSGDVIAFALLAVKGPTDSPVKRAATRGVALPAGFDAWFQKMTAVNPAARFGRATEAVRALAEVLGVAPGARAALAQSTSGSISPVGSGAIADALTGSGLTPVSNPGLMGTSTGGAVTAAPKELRRGARWAALVALGIGVLGVAGVFMALRWGSEPAAPVAAEPAATAPLSSVVSAPAAPTSVAGSAAAEIAPAPSVAPAAVLPTASATSAKASATSAKASATSAVVARPAAKAGGPSAAGSKKPVPTATPLKGLLGRD